MPAADSFWRSALDGHVEPGVYGDTRAARPGVNLLERRVVALVQVAAATRLKDVSQVFPSLGSCPVPGPGRAGRGEDFTVMWTGPGQWLLASDSGPVSRAFRDAVHSGTSPDVAVTDLSHARTVIRIAGPRAVEVLLKGCPLDLDAFSADDCAGSLLSHMNVQLHCVDHRCFDVYVFRSFGLALWHWMRDAAMEYGMEISVG